MGATATFSCDWQLISFSTSLDILDKKKPYSVNVWDTYARVYANIQRERFHDVVTRFVSEASSTSAGSSLCWKNGPADVEVCALPSDGTFYCEEHNLNSLGHHSGTSEMQSWVSYSKYEPYDLADPEPQANGSTTATCITDWKLVSVDCDTDTLEYFDNFDTHKIYTRHRNQITRERSFGSLNAFASYAGDILSGSSLTWDNGNGSSLGGLPASNKFICTLDQYFQRDTGAGVHRQVWVTYGDYKLQNPDDLWNVEE